MMVTKKGAYVQGDLYKKLSKKQQTTKMIRKNRRSKKHNYY